MCISSYNIAIFYTFICSPGSPKQHSSRIELNEITYQQTCADGSCSKNCWKSTRVVPYPYLEYRIFNSAHRISPAAKPFWYTFRNILAIFQQVTFTKKTCYLVLSTYTLALVVILQIFLHGLNCT